jgi:hypothetical protein
MKKSILITVVILNLLLLENVWAQNTNLDFNYAIKIYNLTTYEQNIRSERLNDTSSSYYYYTTTNFQILHPTIAFQWKTKKNNFQEIELTSLIIDKAVTKTEIKNANATNGYLVNGNNIITTSIALRYEYILNFNKLKDRKLVPSIGFSISPYFNRNKISPQLSYSFPTSQSYFGTKMFVAPRLSYFVTSRFFIDLNIPLCAIDAYTLTEKREDPNLKESERSVTTNNFQAFPTIFSGRIGIGLKL